MLINIGVAYEAPEPSSVESWSFESWSESSSVESGSVESWSVESGSVQSWSESSSVETAGHASSRVTSHFSNVSLFGIKKAASAYIAVQHPKMMK